MLADPQTGTAELSGMWARIAAAAAGQDAAHPEPSITVGAAAVARLRIRDRVRPWRLKARPDQQLICDHPNAFIRLAMAGRGWGKGYSITNALAEWAVTDPGDYCAIAPTLGDARKILTESESGLLVALGGDVVNYNKSELVIYVRGGSRIVLASGERPDRLRGFNLKGGIVDELASFPVATVEDLWDNALMPALRKGERPKLAIATTPRRSSPVLRKLVDRAQSGDAAVLLVRGSTFDNEANLSAAFLGEMRERYAGTSTGRQELDGELLADVEGSLVKTALIDETRVRAEHVPDLRRVLVGCDPATTSTSRSDHTGIVAVGIGGPPVGDYRGRAAAVVGDHLYLLDDQSLRATPERWAARVLDVAEEWAAEGITAEQNAGGDMVTTMIRMVGDAEQRQLPRIMPVWASRSKYIRAEPVAGVWQQGRAHVLNKLPAVEDSWASWVPGDPESPDQLDASVHAAVGLMPRLGVKARTEVRVLAG